MTPAPESASLLVVFVKHPTPGRVKTRLAAGIGEAAAAAAYRELVALSLQVVGAWLASSEADNLENSTRAVWFYFDPAEQETAVRAWLDEFVTVWSSPPAWVAQPEGDLGKRLQSVYEKAFNSCFSAVTAIGTDCPMLSVEGVEQAFRTLRLKDVVVGPATDGGYYLIGLKKKCNELFININWSSSTVLRETKAVATRLGLSLGELSMLDDVDTEADWRRWQGGSGI